MIKDKEPGVIDPFIKAIDKPVVAFTYKPAKLRALNGAAREMELSELKVKRPLYSPPLPHPPLLSVR